MRLHDKVQFCFVRLSSGWLRSLAQRAFLLVFQQAHMEVGKKVVPLPVAELPSGQNSVNLNGTTKVWESGSQIWIANASSDPDGAFFCHHSAAPPGRRL